MAIELVCECGKVFRAKDEYAGRRGICPACKAEFVIPYSDLGQGFATSGVKPPTVQPVVAASAATPFAASPVAANAPNPPTPVHAAPIPIQPPPQTNVVSFRIGLYAFLTLMAFAFFANGWSMASKYADFNSGYGYGSGNRFQHDNAMGATANAVEYIGKQYPSYNAASWFIAGLLCWLIAAVLRLTEVIQRRP
jgi:hypothetical protein